MKILRSHWAALNILNATSEAFSLLMVCALARAPGGWKGATPRVESLQFRDFTSFPADLQRNQRDSKQGSLGHHHMAAQQEQTTRKWKIKIFLKSCLESWEMTKSFCTFGKGEKKNKNLTFLHKEPSSDSSLGAFAGPSAFTAVSTSTPH